MIIHLAQITNPAIKSNLGGGSGSSALGILMGNLYNTLIMVSALALLLFLAWGGINWLMSGGDVDKVKKAQDQITNAVIGMVIVIGVVAISNFLSKVLGVDILNPTIPTP